MDPPKALLLREGSCLFPRGSPRLGVPSPTVTPGASAFPFKKNGAARSRHRRSRRRPKGACAGRAAGGSEPRAQRREAGRAIVKGAAAARGAGRGPRRRGPARGGRGSGARTEEPAEERGEGGLPGEGRVGGWVGEGRKGAGSEWMGNAEAPREKGAPEKGAVRTEGGLREMEAPFVDGHLRLFSRTGTGRPLTRAP